MGIAWRALKGAMSSSQTGSKGEDASTPMLPGGASGASQAHVIRMDSSTTNLQSSVSASDRLFALDLCNPSIIIV